MTLTVTLGHPEEVVKVGEGIEDLPADRIWAVHQ
jgi:hypothetical protein